MISKRLVVDTRSTAFRLALLKMIVRSTPYRGNIASLQQTTRTGGISMVSLRSSAVHRGEPNASTESNTAISHLETDNTTVLTSL